MKVLITGATGFVGRAVLREALNRGYQVRILSRSGTAPRDLPAIAVEARKGNVLDPDSLKGIAEGVDAVIHLVGIISEIGRNTFENSHHLATTHVVAASGQANVRRFLHMSALGTRPAAVSRYHQTKWQAEEVVRASGLDYTIFRPSLIFGPGDHFVNLFAQLSRWSPILPLIGGGRTRFQPVHVRTVAEAFIRAITEPRSIGQTYDLCGPDTLTFAEILDSILAAVKRKRLKLPIPLALARLQAALLEWVYPTLLGKAPPLNRDQLIMLQEDNAGDTRPVVQLLRLTQLSFREGISAYLAPEQGRTGARSGGAGRT